MSSKVVKTRVQQKTDTTANWEKAISFIPLRGEVIVYSDVNKMKIGDGVTTVNNLDFATRTFTYDSTNKQLNIL